MSEQQAAAELREKFGTEVRSLDAVRDFLEGEEYSGVQDPAFMRSLDRLNRTLGIHNDSENEPFVADDFRFLDGEFIYRPKKETRQ